ncbi:MAG: class IV adenylate cyclase [Candidatus Dormibacterales bacterium]
MARRGARHVRDRTLESELKFRVQGPAAHARLRAMLRKRGARLTGHYREENIRLTGPGKSTRRTSLRLRVLDGGPRGMLTAKGPATFASGVKIREETETAVSDAHAALDLFLQLGFRVAWTYPKQRSLWILDSVSITLDVLDFGWFVELEGPLDRLPEMARSLGFDVASAVRESYSVLARQFLQANKDGAARLTPRAARPEARPASPRSEARTSQRQSGPPHLPDANRVAPGA